MHNHLPMLGFLALTVLVVAFAWFTSDARFAAGPAGFSTGAAAAKPVPAGR